MACNKVCHGSPTLRNNQRTLRFCKIGQYKAQMVFLFLAAQRKKAQLKIFLLLAHCNKAQHFSKKYESAAQLPQLRKLCSAEV